MGTHRKGSDGRPAGKAEHGYRNEVSWNGGEGFQPYQNQGEDNREPGPAHDFEQGDRGRHSGSNMEQMEQVRRQP